MFYVRATYINSHTSLFTLFDNVRLPLISITAADLSRLCMP